jgi:hypothetical protein
MYVPVNYERGGKSDGVSEWNGIINAMSFVSEEKSEVRR